MNNPNPRLIAELVRHRNNLRLIIAFADDIDAGGARKSESWLAEAKDALEQAGRIIATSRKTLSDLEAHLGGTLEAAQAEHDFVTRLFESAAAAMKGAGHEPH